MNNFPISTAGIIIMLVKITTSHCDSVSFIKPNKDASGVMKYIAKIRPSKNKKLKLKNLFFKMLILKMLFVLLQLIA